MNDAKYIGLDVHQATISAVVLNSAGKILMESILETKAATILQFVHGLRGSLHVTCEEGIFRNYLRLGCVKKLKDSLDRRQIRSKVRASVEGRTAGGRPFSRGALYHLLNN